jgi:hypothetical protein
MRNRILSDTLPLFHGGIRALKAAEFSFLGRPVKTGSAPLVIQYFRFGYVTVYVSKNLNIISPSCRF